VGMSRNKREAVTLPLEDVIEDVRKNRIGVPRFQRPLRWGQADVIKLFDSVQKEYPIGSILLWTTTRPVSGRSILDYDDPPGPNAQWVVDGQQRLTSLAKVLLADPNDPDIDIKYRLYFDVDSEEIVRAPKNRSIPPTWMPLSNVLDLNNLVEWLSESGLSKVQRNAASSLAKRIREYRLSLFVVHSDDQIELQNIFDRVNSSGRRLKRSDVFNALLTSPDSEVGVMWSSPRQPDTLLSSFC
jgi:uncharacterized protein with ParB-like and HNH nuclease domain